MTMSNMNDFLKSHGVINVGLHYKNYNISETMRYRDIVTTDH